MGFWSKVFQGTKYSRKQSGPGCKVCYGVKSTEEQSVPGSKMSWVAKDSKKQKGSKWQSVFRSKVWWRVNCDFAKCVGLQSVLCFWEAKCSQGVKCVLVQSVHQPSDMTWRKKRLLKLALLYDRTNMFLKNRVSRYLLLELLLDPFFDPHWIFFSIPLRIPFWGPWLSPFLDAHDFFYTVLRLSSAVTRVWCVTTLKMPHILELEVFLHAYTHSATTHGSCVGVLRNPSFAKNV